MATDQCERRARRAWRAWRAGLEALDLERCAGGLSSERFWQPWLRNVPAAEPVPESPKGIRAVLLGPPGAGKGTQVSC